METADWLETQLAAGFRLYENKQKSKLCSSDFILNIPLWIENIQSITASSLNGECS